MSHTKELTANKLKVRIYDTRLEMGKHAANDVAERLRDLLSGQETVNMIFAAAPSQNEFLAALSVAKDIAWEKVNAFHMDEYIGLDENAPQRFGQFLRERLFDKVPFREVFYINGSTLHPLEECSRYSALLKKYPADIVCMGIGENGHIAFNDPHVADFNDPLAVKVVKLSEASRHQQVHDECFAAIDEVPAAAITLTIPTLVNANFLYCMVPGATKSRAVYHTLHGEIGEQCPSTILRKHGNATLYLDKDSASELKL
ncbi:MAG: glucosamine-6-phosphate deaminase [Sphingobacteriales bacterium]|nr:glucosamine-6-phosphate deaminase [Sphingobacteriales bacterium]OJY81705.1 MAG: glucosamine-6-phosphate deaminase [Sphingobacteriales bacterium 44-15]